MHERKLMPHQTWGSKRLVALLGTKGVSSDSGLKLKAMFGVEQIDWHYLVNVESINANFELSLGREDWENLKSHQGQKLIEKNIATSFIMYDTIDLSIHGVTQVRSSLWVRVFGSRIIDTRDPRIGVSCQMVGVRTQHIMTSSCQLNPRNWGETSPGPRASHVQVARPYVAICGVASMSTLYTGN